MISADIFDNVLTPVLVPIDLYNLARTCKKYQKNIKMSHIKKSAICEINRRLYKILGDGFDEFKNMMRGADATISGSFVIQCILGEHWQDSDIDIYVDEQLYFDFRCNIQRFNALFDADDEYEEQELSIEIDTNQINLESESKKIINENTEDEKTCESDDKNILKYMKKNYHIEKIHTGYREDTTYIVDFIVNETKIQFIANEPGKNFILDYDFNICKNTYKYEDVFDRDTNLFIYRINEIFTKYTNFAATYDYKKSIKRYIKYHNRGFDFYSGADKITSHNIWNHMNINNNIFKIVPVNESYKKCKSMMMSDLYDFAYIEDGIYYKESSNDGIYCKELSNHENIRVKNRYSRKNKIFKIENEELTFHRAGVKQCHKSQSFECLFNHFNPNICHFHVYACAENLKHTILILDVDKK
jgi:hypothetical protein